MMHTGCSNSCYIDITWYSKMKSENQTDHVGINLKHENQDVGRLLSASFHVALVLSFLGFCAAARSYGGGVAIVVAFVVLGSAHLFILSTAGLLSSRPAPHNLEKEIQKPSKEERGGGLEFGLAAALSALKFDRVLFAGVAILLLIRDLYK